jgi:hypothetical protein
VAAAVPRLLSGETIGAVADAVGLSRNQPRMLHTERDLPRDFWALALGKAKHPAALAEHQEFQHTARTPVGEPLPLTATCLRGWVPAAYERILKLQKLTRRRAELGLAHTPMRTRYPLVRRDARARARAGG